MIVGPAFKSQSAIRGVSVGHVATQCVCMCVCMYVCVYVCKCGLKTQRLTLMDDTMCVYVCWLP